MLKHFMSLAVAVTTIAMSGAIAMSADVYELARMGGEMNAADRDSLEAKVEANPDDSESRTKLLGYYFINGRRDENAKLAKSRHIVWLIENAPESEVLGLPYGQLNKVLEPEGYEKAKQAWLTVIHDSPKNLTASLNASNFFLLHNREIAEELLLHGQEADPTNSVWAASLGQLYSLGLSRLPEGPEKVSVAKKAFQQYKLAYKLSEPLVKQTLLSSLAKTAFEAGSMDEAGEYAREMLADNAHGWNSGNRVHIGNIVIGRIALAKGDKVEAKARLLAAGKTSGSPQLNSFGPNMLLAKELLEQGESDVVLEYFALCDLFWKSPQRELDQWIDDVKANRIPRFGGNLAY